MKIIRFDIIAAYYIYSIYYHDGQWSKLYSLSCIIKERFKNVFDFRKLDGNDKNLTEAGKFVYDRIFDREGRNIRDRRYDNNGDKRIQEDIKKIMRSF